MRTRVGWAPEEQKKRPLERAVSAVLRVGVVASSLLIAAGTAVTLVSQGTRHDAQRSVPQLRRGVLHLSGPQAPHTFVGVLQGAVHGTGPALAMLGLLLLILTPFARVAVSVVSFTLQRDRRFVLITATVLAVLLGSFAVGVGA